MKTCLPKLLIFLLLISFFIPLATEGIEIENPLKYDSFKDFIYRIIDFLFYLALGIAPIMIIVAGFYFVTACGDPQKIDTAKRIILWTLIGLLVIISAKGLIALLGQVIGSSSVSGSGPSIEI